MGGEHKTERGVNMLQNLHQEEDLAQGVLDTIDLDSYRLQKQGMMNKKLVEEGLKSL